MMKNRLLLYGLAALLVFAAAGCQEEAGGGMEDRFVEVQLNLSAAEPETRADQPMIPANENPIYGLWVLQFDAEGLVIGKPEYYPCDEAGELATTLSPKLRAGEGTVCVVANLDPDFQFKVDGRDVDNLTTFRAMLIDAPLVATVADSGQQNVGHLKDKSMYMYGYFQGEVEENQSINILLGRLFLRVNLVLKNSTGAAIGDMTVRIDNVPAKTHIPFVDEPLAGDVFTAYEETVDLGAGLKNGSTVVCYYYMPENVRPAEENATTVTITAGGRSASVRLGNDSPDVTADRNYTLSRNNIYTFDLNLR